MTLHQPGKQCAVKSQWEGQALAPLTVPHIASLNELAVLPLTFPLYLRVPFTVSVLPLTVPLVLQLTAWTIHCTTHGGSHCATHISTYWADHCTIYFAKYSYAGRGVEAKGSIARTTVQKITSKFLGWLGCWPSAAPTFTCARPWCSAEQTQPRPGHSLTATQSGCCLGSEPDVSRHSPGLRS